MDPLTITTSIFGLLKATTQVAQYLAPYIAASRDTPKIVTQVHSEVVYSRTILVALEGLTKNLASIPVKRAALIDVDQLIAVFTNGVLLFSELEASLPSLPPTEPTNPRIPLQTRLQWARKESAFVGLLARLQSFKVSISSILIILQSDSDHRAEVQQQELLKNVAALLETNQALSRRLLNLEDAFEVGKIVSKRQTRDFSIASGTNDGHLKRHQPNEQNEDHISQLPTPAEGIEVSSFDFENDLKTSRPYRRAQRDTMDFSFRSSTAYTNAWSQFSGLSLSKVSIISAIALPLYPHEIENAQHYDLRPEQPMPTTEPTSYYPLAKPLYQSCLEIEAELSQITGFPAIFARQRVNNEEEDPLTFLMQVFRLGIPLLMLLAKVQGVQNFYDHFQLDDYKGFCREEKIPKVATFIFIKAWKEDLRFHPEECFTINNLFGSDSTGFVKVVQIVTHLLDILAISGDITREAIEPDASRRTTELSPRDTIVEEFLAEERSYVADLERLVELKSVILTDVLCNDLLRSFLGSSNPILDTQRRFLLAIEATACQTLNFPTWSVPIGTWFDSYDLYRKFIAIEKNEKEYIQEAVLAEQQLQRIEGTEIKVALTESLRLLYLTSQRLEKYKVFLQDLLRVSNEYQKEDVSKGVQAVQDVLHPINPAIRDEELSEGLEDLVARIQDWKNYRVHDFGKLLLFDDLSCVIEKSDIQKKYHVYLFERILLFCKEASPSRNPARNLVLRRTKSTDSNQAGSIIMTGRVFAKDITEVLSLGSYVCQVFWKGCPDVGNAIMRFTTESKMKTWYQSIDSQRKEHAHPIPEPEKSPSPDNFARMRETAKNSTDESDDGERDTEDMKYQPGTVGGHRSKRWAVLAANSPIAHQDLKRLSGQDLP